MHPSIRTINIFVKVVESRSFAKASRALLIDPTVVSRAVKTLEEDLGAVLLLRSTRVVRLTEEGALFYHDCTQVLQKLTEATERFRVDRKLPHGRLKIGMAPTLPRRLLLRLIPQFQKRYPDIEIVLLSVDNIEDVEKKGIDVLVRARSQGQRGAAHPEPAGMVVRKLADARRVLCASPAYLRRAGSPREPGDLLHHLCLAYVSIERDIQNEWVLSKSQMRRRIKFVPKLLVNGTDALREAAFAGCGIIRISVWNVSDEIRTGKLKLVLKDWDTLGATPMVAVYRKTRPMLPQVSVFVQYLVEAFRRYQ